jgi:hypothetical protein
VQGREEETREEGRREEGRRWDGRKEGWTQGWTLSTCTSTRCLRHCNIGELVTDTFKEDEGPEKEEMQVHKKA